MTHPMTRCVGARVDWLTVAWSCPISDATRVQLQARARFAAEHGCSVEYAAPDGWRAALAPTRRDGWYRLEAPQAVAVVDLHAPGGWCVVVEQSGEHLSQLTDAAGALQAARRVAAALLDAPTALEGARLRRVDLAADFVGFALDDIAADAWLTRRRTTVGRYDASEEASTVRTYSQGRHVTGFVIAPGNPVLCRIYDKSAQLEALHDDERAAAEHAAWRAHGWNGCDDVSRVEYQLRGEALLELGSPSLRDAPETLPAQLDGLWTYLCACWLQLVQLGTSARRTRCALDPRWDAVQGVTFSERAAPAARVRRTGRAAAAQAVGCALSAQADCAQLPEPPGDDEVATMTEPGAALYAHATVHAAMAQTAEDYLAALLARHHGDAVAAARALAAKVAGIRAARTPR